MFNITPVICKNVPTLLREILNKLGIKIDKKFWQRKPELKH